MQLKQNMLMPEEDDNILEYFVPYKNEEYILDE